jgi:hypothetical protein
MVRLPCSLLGLPRAAKEGEIRVQAKIEALRAPNLMFPVACGHPGES